MNRISLACGFNWLGRSARILALVFASQFASVSVHAGNVFVTDYKKSQAETDISNKFVGVAAKQEPDTNATNDTTSAWIKFEDDEPWFGDASVGPFGDGVEYKIDALNYNIFLGDNLKVPFQLYFGDFASSEAPEDVNQKKLLDPTHGVAVQFPIARRYQGETKGGFCNFDQLKGYCVVGGDVTLRGVQLVETQADDSKKEKLIFGASAGLRGSLLFPIFKKGVPGGDQAGHLGLSLGARYYYHDTDNQDLLFGPIEDPEGNPIEFKKDFAAATAEMEFDIYKNFKIRLEYFYPFDNRDVLDDVFKASFVLAPKN